MKKRLVRALLALMVSVSVIEYNTIKITDSMTENDGYIDMNTVTSYSGTADGLHLTLKLIQNII